MACTYLRIFINVEHIVALQRYRRDLQEREKLLLRYQQLQQQDYVTPTNYTQGQAQQGFRPKVAPSLVSFN